MKFYFIFIFVLILKENTFSTKPSQKYFLLQILIDTIKYFVWQFIDQMISHILMRNILYFVTTSKRAEMKHCPIKYAIRSTKT